MSNIIAVLNQKGGVGKTTTVINTGAYMAKSGSSVLLVDADPQGNTTSGVGLDKNQLGSSLYEGLLQNELSLADIVQQTPYEKLFVVPANKNLAAAEVELANTGNREKQLRRLLVNEAYDYVLIDCPPSLGLLTVNALAAADWVIVPVQTEYYALEGLSQLLDVVQRVRRGVNPNLELLGVVATMYDKRTSLSAQVYNQLRQHFGDKLFKTIVPRNVQLAEAPSHGRPIFEHDRWSKGAKAYKQLTKEITNRATT